MTPEDAARCEQLRASFEGRQAIYLEKGALRVQVSKIVPRPELRRISAEVAEVPTLGLGVGLFPDWQRRTREPLRWNIGAGFLTAFSHEYWEAGYGLWTLFFAPAFIQAVIDLASRFPEGLDPWDRYNEIAQWVWTYPLDEKPRRVFAGT